MNPTKRQAIPVYQEVYITDHDSGDEHCDAPPRLVNSMTAMLERFACEDFARNGTPAQLDYETARLLWFLEEANRCCEHCRKEMNGEDGA